MCPLLCRYSDGLLNTGLRNSEFLANIFLLLKSLQNVLRQTLYIGKDVDALKEI